MKTYIYFCAIALFLFCSGCKHDGLGPATSSNYDAANNIFRVKLSSNNAAYTVSLTETSPDGTNNTQLGTQNTGAAFEYPFTPAIGDTIKITAQSNTGSVYAYALYKGVQVSSIPVQSTPNGGSSATFVYVVKN